MTLRERPQDREEGERNESFVSALALDLRPSKGRFERATLRAGQVGQHVADHLGEQVGQADEREAGLDLGGPARQHQIPELGRHLGDRVRQRRLADPGLAPDDGDPEPLCGSTEAIEESGELLLPAQGVTNADCHGPGARIVRPLCSGLAGAVGGQPSSGANRLTSLPSGSST